MVLESHLASEYGYGLVRVPGGECEGSDASRLEGVQGRRCGQPGKPWWS